CNDIDTECLVRDYIEHGKEPDFRYVHQEGFACAWVIIRADIDRRRRRNERARQRRRELRVRQQAEREAAEKDARRVARLERKAVATRSSRKKSRAMRAANAVRNRIAGRSITSPRTTVSDNAKASTPSCLAAPRKAEQHLPVKTRFADRFRGPGYDSSRTLH
ncbi:MAG: hypothetical protein K2G79_08465, partial [Muribaculum sp.]|nr:hypothetical protein [Muribaculum sp.]